MKFELKSLIQFVNNLYMNYDLVFLYMIWFCLVCMIFLPQVCSELEEEKRKHAQDTAQGDDVTYMLEKERERLRQEVTFVKFKYVCVCVVFLAWVWNRQFQKIMSWTFFLKKKNPIQIKTNIALSPLVSTYKNEGVGEMLNCPSCRCVHAWCTCMGTLKKKKKKLPGLL